MTSQRTQPGSLSRFAFISLSWLGIFGALASAADASPAVQPVMARPIGLNDVSILLPLPTSSADHAKLLAPTDGGMIPDEILGELPRLITTDADSDERLASLRVLAIRFDPCFSEGTGPVACRRQLRLVFQPLAAAARGGATAFDAALHAFYDFNDGDWAALISDWKQALVTDDARDASAAKLPLQVHPIIKAEGLKGPTWARLRRLVFKHCVPGRLSRVTTMTLGGGGTQWIFLGYEVQNAKLASRIKIARIGRMAQAFFADLSNTQEFQGTIQPAPPDSDWMAFLVNSVDARASLSQSKLKAVMASAIAFENPKLNNPGTVDCVSCHVAQTVRLWGENEWQGWRKDAAITKFLFASARPLENTSENAFRVNRLRAFGYFVDEAVISQRVINESAVVADQMQAYLN